MNLISLQLNIMKLRHTFIVDGSHNGEAHVIGIGIAVHETDKLTKSRNGILIDQISESYQGILPGHGEMLALFRALELAKDRGYKIIRLRSDYNSMRKALKKSYEQQTEFERVGLYGEVMRITKNFDSVQFGYKPRRKNQMAHNLARVGAKEIEPVRDIRLINICKQSDAKLRPSGPTCSATDGGIVRTYT